MYTATASPPPRNSWPGIGRGRRYSGARSRSTSYRVSPLKYSVVKDPVSMTPRRAPEDEANAGARDCEPGVESREDDGPLAHASAQRNTAGYAERITILLSRDRGVRFRTSRTLDRRSSRPGPSGLGRAVPRGARGEQLDGRLAAGDGRLGGGRRGTGDGEEGVSSRADRRGIAIPPGSELSFRAQSRNCDHPGRGASLS